MDGTIRNLGYCTTLSSLCNSSRPFCLLLLPWCCCLSWSSLRSITLSRAHRSLRTALPLSLRSQLNKWCFSQTGLICIQTNFVQRSVWGTKCRFWREVHFLYSVDRSCQRSMHADTFCHCEFAQKTAGADPVFVCLPWSCRVCLSSRITVSLPH